MGKVVLKLSGSPKDHEYHMCDNPEQAVWRELLIYAEPFVLKKFWNASKNDELTQFVCTSIRQAYEYYKAIRQLGENTSPLFLYYVCHNLTKAALTVKNDSIDGLGHHGLSVADKKSELFDFSVRQTENGVFGALAKEFGMTWANNKAEEFTFGEFARNTIELVDPVANIFEEEINILPVSITRDTEGLVHLAVQTTNAEERMRTRKLINARTEVNKHFDENSGDDASYDYSRKYADKESMLKEGSEIIRKLFSFSYLPCNERVAYLDVSERKYPQECCYYGMAYILGMIVRYSPHILGKILTDPDSKYRWLIEEVCLNIKRIYPNLMLNLMTGKSFKFITSA